jgi:FkbM family methyltransferase
MTFAPASPVLDLVCCSRLSSVLDIGANPIDGDPPYKRMLESGLCTVTGFEPQRDALAELERRKGPLEKYLPHAVGDGETHRLKITKASGMTSLLAPDAKRLHLFNGFTEWGTVIDEDDVQTHRLDKIDDVPDFDLLKIDTQGGELMVFRNGREKLTKAVAVQTEVSFVPLYEHQPTFGDVDSELRFQGFLPHSFPEIKRWAIAPTSRRGGNQLLEADIVYVRDIAYPERMTTEQLSQLAMIAFHVYHSIDLTLFCIIQLCRRGQASEDAGAQFVQRVATPLRLSRLAAYAFKDASRRLWRLLLSP